MAETFADSQEVSDSSLVSKEMADRRRSGIRTRGNAARCRSAAIWLRRHTQPNRNSCG